jgi:hypothetical protein
VEGATGRAVAPVLDAVGDPSRALDQPLRSTGEAAAGVVSGPGRLLSPVVPPAVTGVGTTADTVVPKVGGSDQRAPGHGGAVPALGAPADAHAAEEPAAADGSPPNGRALGIAPPISGTLANPTSAAPSLGG